MASRNILPLMIVVALQAGVGSTVCNGNRLYRRSIAMPRKIWSAGLQRPRPAHRFSRRDKFREVRAEQGKGPISMTGGMQKKVEDPEDIEARTEEAVSKIGMMYEDVVRGMERIGGMANPGNLDAERIVEAIKKREELSDLDFLGKNEGIDEIVVDTVKNHIGELDEYFLAILNQYIYQIRKSAVDQSVSVILSLIREEVLNQVTARLPPHMQLIQKLSESSDENEWAEMLGESMGMDPNLLAAAQGWVDPDGGLREVTDDEIDSHQEDIRTLEQDAKSKASLDVLMDEAGTEPSYLGDMDPLKFQRDFDIPKCTPEELYLGVSHIIDDLEEVAVIPDFRLLIKLILIREKILELDGALALTDTTGKRANLGHLIASTKGQYAAKVTQFLTALTQCATEIESQRILYMTFRQSDQATRDMKNDDAQEQRVEQIRPGEFMSTLMATMTDMASTIGTAPNTQIIDHVAEEFKKDAQKAKMGDMNDPIRARMMLSKLQTIKMDAMTVLRYILDKTTMTADEFYSEPDPGSFGNNQ